METTLASPALQQKINACAAQGGGRVTIPPGIHVCGTLELRSNIELYLEAGAVIQGSHDINDYPQQEGASAAKDDHKRHLILAHDCDNVAITGRGVIDGQGPAFWQERKHDRGWIYAKPQRVSPMVEITECRDVVIDGITLRESPGWTLHLESCDRVRLNGVRVDNHRFGPNNDGFDINGCRDVMISQCHIETCDDAIVLKTSENTRSCERVTISDCVLSCNCAAIKCGTESFHDYRQIVVNNCVVTRSTRAFALYTFDGATIEQIRVSNLVCDTDIPFIFNHPIHFDARKRHDESRQGIIRDVRIQNFSAKTDGRLLFTAADETRIEDIELEGIRLEYPLFCDPAPVSEGYTGQQVSRHSPEARAARAALVLENITRLNLRGFSIDWPSSTHAPGWGEGLPRMENGGDRVHGPSDQGDDVAFAVLWQTGCRDCDLDLGSLQASDSRAQTLITR